MINLSPGLYPSIPADVYHKDPCLEPSLSRTIGWKLATNAPIHAKIAHPRLNGMMRFEQSTPEMDFGSLGHALILGKQEEIEVGDFDDFRTSAAKLFRDTARAHGKTPVLRHKLEVAQVMRDMAIEQIDRAGFGDLFSRATPEASAIAKIGDIYARARFDKLLIHPETPSMERGAHATIFDLKITDSADPETCAKQIGNMGYAFQKAFYSKVLGALPKEFTKGSDLVGRIRFVFFLIDREYPHCLTPIELNGEYDAIGNSQLDRAIRLWGECLKTNEWPTYANGHGTFTVAPPKYIYAKEFEREVA